MIKSSVCITQLNNKVISWLDVNSKMEMLSVSDCVSDIIGNIYVGKVKHVLKNLDACFVEFCPDTLGFLSYNDVLPDTRIVEGADIAVQIIKEASKNKEAVLSMKLSIAGAYSVVEIGDGSLSISKKITGDKRSELKAVFEGKKFENNVIVRTNACNLEDVSALENEIDYLNGQLSDIRKKAITRTPKSLIYKAEPEYVRFLKGIPEEMYERVITDREDIAADISMYSPVIYNDTYPFTKLYSLETKLDEVLSRQVWLKSGGNIVIDYTEAMCVIDVNSAKNIAKKDREVNVLKTNIEAAEEIMRQLRLRNISGMILVDFINMADEENQKKLVTCIKENTAKDNTRCDFVDFTKLGLAEIVRRKMKPPVYEMLKREDYI